MTHPSTFDYGSLTLGGVGESAGDLGDVWDTAPGAMAAILEGPRKIEPEGPDPPSS